MPMYRSAAMMAKAADQSVEQSYSAAEMKFTSTVNAQYDLDVP